MIFCSWFLTTLICCVLEKVFVHLGNKMILTLWTCISNSLPRFGKFSALFIWVNSLHFSFFSSPFQILITLKWPFFNESVTSHWISSFFNISFLFLLLLVSSSFPSADSLTLSCFQWFLMHSSSGLLFAFQL